MSETSGGDTAAYVPKELASLVPSFDPSTDNVNIWTSKVELLLTTWPPSKLNELATRLILGCKGTAYQKLQLLRHEVLTNDEKGIQRLVEVVGGTWGQVPLEKKFELAERALFRSIQKADESSDSYLSRCDVIWTELLSRKMSLSELQAYIVLRGSKLPPEDKKRVIVESKDASDSSLTKKNVTAAIRLLGSGFFFQGYTGIRRDKVGKTYDHTALHMDDEPENEQEAFVLQDDLCEDDILETLAAENDEDAILVMQFEDSISETIQSDSELAAFYANYQEARRRLSERVKVRGFWPINRRSDKGFGKKGKGKGKGKTPFSGPGSLARRIANSFCRICMQKGHWKNECPQRAGGNSSSSNTATVAPTSVVIAEEVPEEIAHFTIVDDQDHQAEQACFGVMTSQRGNLRTGDNRGKIMMDKLQFVERFHLQWKRHDRTKKSSEGRVPIRSELEQQPLTSAPACPDSEQMSLKPLHPSEAAVDTQICDVHFATAGTVGIVDLGASQTVIGDAQVKELIQNLPERVQSQIQRTTCNLTFRFGNQQTLTSRHALLLPLGHAKFRIAIVPGKAPFLLSSSFLKEIKAVIDTDTGVLWSKTLNRELMVSQSSKNLFLMDISQLWQGPNEEPPVQKSSATGFTCLQVPIQNTASSLMPESSNSVSSGLSQGKVVQVTGENSCQQNQDSTGLMTENVNNLNDMTMHSQFHDARLRFSQPSGSLCEADAQHISDVHHVQRGHQVDSVSRGAEEDRVQGRDGTHPGNDTGAIGQRTHRVRQGQDGTNFSGSVRGPFMRGPTGSSEHTRRARSLSTRCMSSTF